VLYSIERRTQQLVLVVWQVRIFPLRGFDWSNNVLYSIERCTQQLVLMVWQVRIFPLRGCDWSNDSIYSHCGAVIGRTMRHIPIAVLRLVERCVLFPLRGCDWSNDALCSNSWCLWSGRSERKLILFQKSWTKKLKNVDLKRNGKTKPYKNVPWMFPGCSLNVL
jgi:hypothetical protein